jgi:hypothetical protein
MFDFYGLGQQGQAPQHQANDQFWGNNGVLEKADQNEQVDQNVLGFDLNMEDVVEGDDEALQLHEQLLLELHQGGAAAEQPVVLDLNAPPSLNLDSFADQSSNSSVLMGSREDPSENTDLVLALQAPTINFGVDEIQPHELMSEDEGLENSANNGNQLQVGMVLLPSDLKVDPGFPSLVNESEFYKKRSAKGVRLWTRHFAPVGGFASVQVPLLWEDFFIASLLNPSRFDWAKNFLSSEAWNVILNDCKGDSSPFSLPQKCPSKRKLGCVISELSEATEEGSVEKSVAQEETPEGLIEASSLMHDKEILLEHSASPGAPAMLTEAHGNEMLTPNPNLCPCKPNATTSALLARRKASKAPLVVTEVRRSVRLKGKSITPPPPKDCFCYAVDPPTFSGKVIHSLGTSVKS